MTLQHSSDQVWREIEKNTFGVLGMVTPQSQSRTVGIVYVVDNRKLFIGAQTTAWKTKHIVQNPNVSMTIPIARNVPLMPWIKVPATTITFAGIARILSQEEVSTELLQRLYRHEEGRADWCAIEVSPQKDFITYGLGISVLQMRFPERARGRAEVEGDRPPIRTPRDHPESNPQ